MDTHAVDVPRLAIGAPEPLGATWTGQGVNFAVFSGTARSVELCVFDADGKHELHRLALPARTGDIWHGFLPAPLGRPGLAYGYRVPGPWQPASGLRHDPSKLLVDPYAKRLVGTLAWNDALFSVPPAGRLEEGVDSAPWVCKATVVDDAFDWDDDRPPAVPWRDTVIYELHVKGYTQLHPDVPEAHRGKYLGLAHPAVITHLRRLGVTAVELLPVQSFATEQFLAARGLTNYWGYNPLAWFAPAAAYAVADPVSEFKAMVKALHAAGIEVILDVVFNHTAEGNQDGPTLSLKGFDNAAYYRLPPEDRSAYENHTGTGNTLAIGSAIAQRLVVDCLRYWTEVMHVDGFRFDLAPVLGRDGSRFSPTAGFFRAVQAEPALRYVKLIAEPWDLGPDGHQTGRFPDEWSEWNDRYRDDMRAFWRGDDVKRGAFAERFAGSSDLFRGRARRPTASINFVTCHDGFTLYDLVAHDRKHNAANLEENRDGTDHNLSWNSGEEGPSQDPGVLELRERRMRNLLATLLLSQGVPMLLAGDEFGRTQRGNNNAYCQDSPLSWVDWTLARERASLVAFTRQLLFIRRQASALRRDAFLKGARQPDRHHKDVTWWHPDGREVRDGDWHEAGSHAIGVLIGHAFFDLHGTANGHLLLLCNAGNHPARFVLPQPASSTTWLPAFDTARWQSDAGPRGPEGGRQVVMPHACVLLVDGDVPPAVRERFAELSQP